MAGREFDVAAEELEGNERERTWAEIISAAPGVARYQDLTDRQIPIIRLTPRTTAAGSGSTGPGD
ncbi:nitroreductase family deazaflavin-dependent oxidoreductase [Actinoplanes sp. LDG1-01]|uniref:Nitroreductase family deazaflavin-dependent oxidoreductase n=1 Tax=Paractinoplanes lichenicola TaxID=2802976 RepID=A0ABS1W1A5_9ACTN|nr:nitroreductase family deazaflavin-dependent oxidoreductase [Actinoplanes lichenicola]